MIEQIEFIYSHSPQLLFGFPGQRPGGLLLSVMLAILAIVIGFFFALLVGAGQQSRSGPVRWVCQRYIDIFRGLPLILLVIIIYQLGGVRILGFDINPLAAALIALVLYSSAYQAEIVRAGLLSVPRQHVESARVLGSSPLRAFFTVELPYALRVMTPAFVGQAISLFKDTSVLVIIGAAELMTITRAVLGSDITNLQHWITLYLFVGLLYFGIAYAVSLIARRWEEKSRSSELVHSLTTY